MACQPWPTLEANYVANPMFRWKLRNTHHRLGQYRDKTKFTLVVSDENDKAYKNQFKEYFNDVVQLILDEGWEVEMNIWVKCFPFMFGTIPEESSGSCILTDITTATG